MANIFKNILLALIALLTNCNMIISAEGKTGFIQKEVDKKPSIEKVKTIQLDTTKNGLISFPMRIFMMNSGKYIIHEKLVKMYAAEGKYLKNIGAIGEGKGEYHATSYLFTNGTIIGIYNRYKNMILFYDENGNYMKNIYLKGGSYYTAVFYEDIR